MNMYRTTDVMNRNGEIIARLPGVLCAFLEDGSMVSKGKNKLMKFDRELKIMWEKNLDKIHHDIALSPDEKYIYVLSSDFHEFVGHAFRFDVIYKLTHEGEIIYKWCTYDHLKNLIMHMISNPFYKQGFGKYDPEKPPEYYYHMNPKLFEIFEIDSNAEFQCFHMNSIQELGENIHQDKNEAFKPRNLLLSFCMWRFIAIMDQDNFEIKWLYYHSEITNGQHTPQMLENGNILMFVNSTDMRPYASVREIDPITKKTVWEYEAQPRERFHSLINGSTQRLKNGNTLISEKDSLSL